MNDLDLNGMLDKFPEHLNELQKTIQGLQKSAMDFIPDSEDAWSSREHLIHLLGKEYFSYVLYNYPENKAIQEYHSWEINRESDLTKIINLMKELRAQFVSQNKFENRLSIGPCKLNSSTQGEKTIPLHQSIQAFINHQKFHEEYIETNIKEYSGKIGV
jgi:hypothetical protein